MSGVLAHFDVQTLHGNADAPAPSGDTVDRKAGCTFAWPDDADQGFEVLVAASYVGPGAVLSEVSVTTVRSDCALRASLDSPARYLEVGGINDTVATLRLHYTCPSGQGSAGVTVSSANGIEMGGPTASCTAMP